MKLVKHFVFLHVYMKQGRLDLIIGPMFSAKTTTLLSRIEKYERLQKPFLVVKHASDTRYSDGEVVSHTNLKHKCLPLQTLMPLMEDKQYQTCEAVFIDEGQFFEDLSEFCRVAVDNHQKVIVIAALDGDYRRQVFPEVAKLIGLCDTITKLKAICVHCTDGTEALFSRKKDLSTEETVGAAELYEPVCRNHYNAC